MMKSHKITGGEGLQLHLVETGNSSGRPIMFIHGVSQCWLTWSRQMNSDLADDHRLVAMDIRGHGLSDKPREGYTDNSILPRNAIIHGDLSPPRPMPSRPMGGEMALVSAPNLVCVADSLGLQIGKQNSYAAD